jgi:hypothetical protein
MCMIPIDTHTDVTRCSEVGDLNVRIATGECSILGLGWAFCANYQGWARVPKSFGDAQLLGISLII